MVIAKCSKCGGSAISDTFEQAKNLINHAVGLSRGIKCGDNYNLVKEIKPETKTPKPVIETKSETPKPVTEAKIETKTVTETKPSTQSDTSEKPKQKKTQTITKEKK